MNPLKQVLTFSVLFSVLGPCLSLAQASAAPAKRHPFLKSTPFTAEVQKGYAPSEIRHLYGFDTQDQLGSGKTVAIIDAYHDPAIIADLVQFDTAFKLSGMHGLAYNDQCTIAAGPHPCFSQRGTAGLPPPSEAGWKTESALDVEWSHAIAPSADIILMETKDSSVTELMKGVANAVTARANVVSMSWGGSEFRGETSYDATFSDARTAFVASSGDSGTGVSFPASAPTVLAVGGTTLKADKSGNRLSEKAWSGSGGGASKYEKRPSYQPMTFKTFIKSSRLVPDVSLNADPATGYSVYSGSQGGWSIVGGTSAAAPQWAALLILGKKADSPSSLYSLRTSTSPRYFYDIQHGSNGTCKILCSASTGYDTVTGLGSPVASSLAGAL